MNTCTSSTSSTGCHSHHGKCFSWGSILAGALVGIGLSFLLSLFSIAIGLSIISTSTDGMVTLAVGGLLGVLIGTLVSMWFAGFTAGFLSYKTHCDCNMGVIYGFVTWCFALIISMFIAAHMGQYVVAYTAFVSNPTAIVTVKDQTTTVTTTSKADKATVTVDNSKAAFAAGTGAFVIFTLFFLGAVSASIGGYYGADCRRRCAERDM